MTDCSIVIPVHGLAEVTRQCLNRLLVEVPPDCDHEIIVVDDASRDGTLAMLAEYGTAIRVVAHERNQGFSHACNSGAEVAAGRHLVFLNNDTIPLAGWLDALVHHAEAHPLAAIVGSKLLYPDGTIQHAGMVFDADRHPQHIYRGFAADHPAVNRSRPFRMVTGACMLISRATYEVAGGFDTAFVNGYEDVDLCLRVGAFGREVHYCHESVLIHLESVSEGRTARDCANHDQFSRRWKSKVAPDDLLYYQEDGLLRFAYRGVTPMTLTLAPELGVIDDEARQSVSDRLLSARAEQVRALLRETITLRVHGGRGIRSA
jgi:GT2 family glycosyltransferase